MKTVIAVVVAIGLANPASALDSDLIDARAFGAVGNGRTDDSAKITEALNACRERHGGVVRLPATGSAYVIEAGLILPSGCSLEGSSGLAWPGPYNNTMSAWTNVGTWLYCKDRNNPCISITGVGSFIRQLNVWYDQPTPKNGSACPGPCTYTHDWTPTAYPYTILVGGSANFTTIEKITIVNATHCIDFEGPETGVAGIYTRMSDMFLGCFIRGTKFHRIDNTVYVSDLRYILWWYPASSDVLGFTEGDGNKIDWDLQYVANIQGDGIEFSQSATAMLFTDDTVSSGFGRLLFAVNEMQLANVSFNEVCQATALATGTTHVTGVLTNVIAYADTLTSTTNQCAGKNKNFFSLQSDNVDLTIDNLRGGHLETVGIIGNGNFTAKLRLKGSVTVQKYSAFNFRDPAFVANGGTISVDDKLFSVTPNKDAGVICKELPAQGARGGCSLPR
jgi:hypothetical protein